MIKKTLQTLVIAIACSFVASAPMYAVEFNGKQSGRHAAIRTEVPSLDQENEAREQRAQEDRDNFANQDQIPLEERSACKNCSHDNEQESAANDEKVINGAYYFTTHPDAEHNPINISGNGSTIETEDMAIYSVKRYDWYKTVNWQPYHTILLVPNHSWFSSYYFKFVNLDTGESAAVNMTLGPVYENTRTHWIEAIDYDARMIRLEDNSMWSMSWLDQGIVNTLERYDVVVIGTNDGWWKGSNPNILMAIKSFKYARGAKVN